jgi:hypothetical protein
MNGSDVLLVFFAKLCLQIAFFRKDEHVMTEDDRE